MELTKTVYDAETGVSTVVPLTHAEMAELTAREQEAAAFVPPIVSPYQAKVALHRAGLLSAVETMMESEGVPFEAKLAWKNATQFERHSPFIATLGPLLGLTESQIDDLFRTAAAIN